MISCTEFIPAYSELFKYIQKRDGKEAVRAYWEERFSPKNGRLPLIPFVEKEGLRGCYSYWTGTLSEEAADFTLYLNEKAGWFKLDMHKCPSKGRLLELRDQLGVAPYSDYCLHCDHYRAAIENVGLNYVFDCSGADHAACSILVTEPKTFTGQIVVDENTEIMDCRASDNEYFHPGFHRSLNAGVDYIGEKYGEEGLVEYLTTYTNLVYVPVFKAIEKDGLAAIEAKILDTYKKEKVEDAVQTVLENDTLTVTVSACPAVAFMKATGTPVSKWYPYTTSVIMSVLAEKAGCRFEMQSYDEETGAAKYRFCK